MNRVFIRPVGKVNRLGKKLMKKIIIGVLSIVVLLIGVFYIGKWLSPRKLVLACVKSEEALYKELIDIYTSQDNKKIKIELLVIDESEYSKEDFKPGGIDIISIPGQFSLDALEKTKQLAEIKNVSKNSDYLLSVDKNEKIYTLPLNGSVPLLLSRRDVLERNGLFIPKAVAGFADISLAMQIGDDYPFILKSLSDGNLYLRTLADGILLNGSAETFTLYDEAGGINEGFNTLQSLANVSNDKRLITDEAEVWERFEAGDVAVFPVDSKDIIGRDLTDEKYSLTLLSVSDLNSYIPWTSGMRVSILSKSRAKSEAEKFVDFLVSKEAQSLIYARTSMLPVSKSVTVEGQLAGIFNEELVNNSHIKTSIYERVSGKTALACDTELSKLFRGEYFQNMDFVENVKQALTGSLK